MLLKCEYLISSLVKYFLRHSRLHKEVDAFVQYISPSREEHDARSLTVEIISRAIVEAYPDAMVLPFGSFETKLYLPLGQVG